jgi:hypothetical protein
MHNANYGGNKNDIYGGCGTLMRADAHFDVDNPPYSRREKIALAVVLSAIFAIQMCIAHCLEYQRLNDVNEVFNGAVGLSEGYGLINPEYFATFPNNFPITLFMSVVFRFARFITFGRVGYFMMYAAMLGVFVELGMLALFDATRSFLSKKTAVAVLIIASAYIPLYTFPCLVYTDVATVSAPIIIINLYHRLLSAGDRRKRNIIAVLLGIVLSFGTLFRVTVFIVFIAILLTAWMQTPRGAGAIVNPLEKSYPYGKAARDFSRS